MGGNHFEDRGTVGHILRHRPDLVQGRTVGDQTPAGYRTVSRFDTGHAAEGAWLADRSAGIAAQCVEGLSCCHSGTGATGGTARHMLRIPRVSRHTIGRGLCRTSHGKFIHIGLADDHCTGILKAFHSLCGKGRYKIIQDFGAAGCQHTFCTHIVLDGHRYTCQRSGQLTLVYFFLDFSGFFQCTLFIYGHIGMHRIFHTVDLIQHSLCGLHRCQLFFLDLSAEFHGST